MGSANSKARSHLDGEEGVALPRQDAVHAPGVVHVHDQHCVAVEGGQGEEGGELLAAVVEFGGHRQLAARQGGRCGARQRRLRCSKKVVPTELTGVGPLLMWSAVAAQAAALSTL